VSDIPDTAGPWPGWAPGDPAPASLRAELAEAKATIARLEAELSEERAHQLQAAKDYSNTIGPMIRERDASRAIVEAATALVENWYPLGHNFRDVCGEQENEMLYRALDDAVEEGNKT
jgi:hypothetical protein